MTERQKNCKTYLILKFFYQNSENEDHRVSREWVERLPVFVDEVFVLDLAGHHDQRLHDRSRNIDVEALEK